MRKQVLLALCAFAVVPAGVALAESDGLKVTGGGQVVAGDQTGGPGDTIAFVAQQTSDTALASGAFPAKGQLQVNRRGDDALKFHGNVTCIREFDNDDDPSNGTFVRFGGFRKVTGQSDETQWFTVDVQDNGEGLNATGADMIFFRERAPEDDGDPCDTSDQSTTLRSSTLARGNVQTH